MTFYKEINDKNSIKKISKMGIPPWGIINICCLTSLYMNEEQLSTVYYFLNGVTNRNLTDSELEKK